MVKSYENIGKYIEEQNKEDAIVIVGGERLVSCCAENTILSLKFEDNYSSLHLQEDENWVEFSECIDKLFEKYQSDITGLVFICNVNNTIADKINKALESSNNMSICRTEILGCNRKGSDNVTMVMREIKNKSLREALEIIEKNIDILDSKNVIMCQAIAYHGNGDITKTIEFWRSVAQSTTRYKEQWKKSIKLGRCRILDKLKLYTRQDNLYVENNYTLKIFLFLT